MQRKTKILIIFIVMAALLLPGLVMAQGVPRSPVIKGVKRLVAQADQIIQPGGALSCDFESVEKAQYSAQFIAVRKRGVVAQGEMFETRVYLRNTGNIPWFASNSGCPGLRVKLGTDAARDRESIFFTADTLLGSGWEAPNRIKLTTPRVNPGELAEFRFWSRAPYRDGYFREIYTPVVEGVRWMDEATFTTDTRVGEGTIPVENKDLLQYIHASADLSSLNIEGDKWIEVDISEQKMRLHVGDFVVREFPVSTGTYRTPTPLGTTHIFQKQEVRVASSYPRYIMPKWLHFRKFGYGIHALPSLANDGGVFWTEALNHIGTRRSHGCIRLLPKDAEFTFDFAEIGTKVSVVP